MWSTFASLYFHIISSSLNMSLTLVSSRTGVSAVLDLSKESLNLGFEF